VRVAGNRFLLCFYCFDNRVCARGKMIVQYIIGVLILFVLILTLIENFSYHDDLNDLIDHIKKEAKK
jgi:hypothetical protein